MLLDDHLQGSAYLLEAFLSFPSRTYARLRLTSLKSSGGSL